MKKKILLLVLSLGLIVSMIPVTSFAKVKTYKVYNSKSIKLEFPKKTKKKITWKSSNTKVAKVKSGKVYAYKYGTCTVTAKAGSKKAKYKIHVPVYYKGYKVPSFGAYLGVRRYYKGVEDYMRIEAYKFKSSSTAKSQLSKYEKLLRKKGFTEITKDNKTMFMNDDGEFAFPYREKKEVAIGYGNMYDAM